MLTNQNNLQDGQNGHLTSSGQVKALEGQGMGGHNFGNGGKITPMGDDRDNPSRNAGYSNAYFARVEPSDEDTANNNFKAAYQQGEPDYDSAQKPTNSPQEMPEQEKASEGNNQQESQEQAYHEPELDEQQPDHGSGTTETGEERDHIET